MTFDFRVSVNKDNKLRLESLFVEYPVETIKVWASRLTSFQNYCNMPDNYFWEVVAEQVNDYSSVARVKSFFNEEELLQPPKVDESYLFNEVTEELGIYENKAEFVLFVKELIQIKQSVMETLLQTIFEMIEAQRR